MTLKYKQDNYAWKMALAGIVVISALLFVIGYNNGRDVANCVALGHDVGYCQEVLSR